MKKHFLLYIVFAVTLSSCHQNSSKEVLKPHHNAHLVDLVNPLMGTDSKFELSNGNTYPAIAMPWGMNFWTPQTNVMGNGWAYQYSADKIRGFKQTHQPSPWINDYGAFSLMPIVGKLNINEEDRASWFSHKTEEVKPNYYSVYLADYDTKVEITPTERAAQFRFTFPQSDSTYVLLDAFFKGSMVKIIPEERKIIGYCQNNSGGVPDNFKNYFVAVFDKNFEVSETWTDEWKIQPDSLQSEGKHTGAIIGFKTLKGEQVTVKVASSFISPEQAMLNLEREIGNDSFDVTRLKALNAWAEMLGRIEIEDDNLEHIRTFYSCLYRVLLFPRKFYEYDADEQVIHYSPYTGKVLPGYMFTDNGFWDTFRAVFPLFNLMYPDTNQLIMKGLVNTYKESGWLPEWASPGHRDCMIGSNSAPIIAESFLKGNVEAEDAEILLEAMLKNATQDTLRPVKSVGREGVDFYNDLGYVPYDVGINENVARTLEYAYADYAIAEMAQSMQKDSLANIYRKKAMNYKNVFDPETKWMRGKNQDGSFQSPFNPLKWGDAFTEGNSLHYTWSVFQDIEGLSELMGGHSAMEKKLDEVFEMPPSFDDSYYGFTIHEIREMQLVNMGNYAHGNQPIQHMPYLYDYVGKPYKTQKWVREIMKKLYAPTPDGYCGDEDNGQTSAWYVFSALGFYPVNAVSGEYCLGSPLFKRATLKLRNQKSFVIKGKKNSDESIYVKSTYLKGKPLNHSFINYKDIITGGLLIFNMSNQPHIEKVTSLLPFSLSNKKPEKSEERPIEKSSSHH